MTDDPGAGNPERAGTGRATVAAFSGLAAALALGVYANAWLPEEIPDSGWVAVYLAGSLAPVIVALMVANRIPLRKVLAELGLDRPARVGLGWALLLTAPMVIGFAVMGRGVFGDADGWGEVTRRPWLFLKSWAGAGLVEEVLFRGFLYRQLVVRGGWGSGRAMVLCGVIFGALHLPSVWGEPPGQMAGTVAVTAIGGAAFCWLLKEWRWNLWFLVGWHALVNLWWTLGQAGGAVGEGSANLLRIAIIVLTFALTAQRDRLPSNWLGDRD